MEEVAKQANKAIFTKVLGKAGSLWEEYKHYCEHAFLPFLERNYDSLTISTSQLFRNEGYRIEDLYVPLIIRNSDFGDVEVDCFPEKVFIKENKVLLADSAGMGKSTLLKMIYKYIIDEGVCIPFYIDLKNLVRGADVVSVEDYLFSSFPSLEDKPSKEFFFKLLDNNFFIFLFDGADEVPDDKKEDVFKKVDYFSKIASSSKFMVATRKEDRILSSFFTYKAFSILPLNKEQSYEILRRYQFKDVGADDLIKEIEKEKNSAVKEFLKNPLLTTLLYTAFVLKRNVPLKKSLFFSQVYESLYENHDSTKPGYLTRKKKSGLDIDQFEKILSHLAFRGRNSEKLEYEKKDLIAEIRQISEQYPTLKFDVNGFVSDLITNVPVFRVEGTLYSWQHKSIQEYFFVRFCFIVLNQEQREKVLSNLLNSESISKYILLFDLFYDVEPELFHLKFTKEIVDFYKREFERYGDKVSDDIFNLNLFVRFIAVNVTERLGEEFYEDMMGESENDPSFQFDFLREYVKNNYLTEGFVNNSVNITHADSIYFQLLYSSKYLFPLRILFEKGESFVSEMEIPQAKNFSNVTDIIENFTEYKGFEYIGSRRGKMLTYKLDVKSCEKFLRNLDLKIKERNLNLDLEGF